MAKYVFNQKEYANWIVNTDIYKNAPIGSPLRKLDPPSDEAIKTYRPLFAQYLKEKYGEDAADEFKKNKPFEAEKTETAEAPVEEVKTEQITEPEKPQEATAEQPIKVGGAKEDPYAKFYSKSNYRINKLLSDLASSKAYQGKALANLGMGGVGLLTGLGQMIAGRKKGKELTPPKYPAEMLPNQQLASRLAQAQVEAQMADPVIREKLLSDLASQKMVADEIARATSGGDISAYAGLSQANAGNISKALRDIAVQEGVDKLRKQQVLDQLIGAKMDEERQAYEDKLAKFASVDYPEFQAQREYAAGLTNKGLSNILESIKTGTQMVAPFVQGKSMQQGFASMLEGLSPEKQTELLKKYPALEKYLKTSQKAERPSEATEETPPQQFEAKLPKQIAEKYKLPFEFTKFTKTPSALQRNILPYSLQKTGGVQTGEPSMPYSFYEQDIFKKLYPQTVSYRPSTNKSLFFQ